AEIGDTLWKVASTAGAGERGGVEVELYRDSMPKRLVLQERDRLFDDLVDVQWDHLRVDLFRELANPVNHLAGAMRVRYDFPDTGDRLFDIRSLTAQPPQAAFCIGHNGGERLVAIDALISPSVLTRVTWARAVCAICNASCAFLVAVTSISAPTSSSSPASPT